MVIPRIALVCWLQYELVQMMDARWQEHDQHLKNDHLSRILLFDMNIINEELVCLDRSQTLIIDTFYIIPFEIKHARCFKLSLLVSAHLKLSLELLFFCICIDRYILTNHLSNMSLKFDRQSRDRT